MKLRDFLMLDIDYDVEGSLTDDWRIAFVGPLYLIKEGEEKFGPILDNEVTFFQSKAEVQVEDEGQDELASTLFYAAAGYCSVADFQNYFIFGW